MQRFVLGLLFLLVYAKSGAQNYFKTDYSGTSHYVDENGEKIDGKGDMLKAQLGVLIPLYVKQHANKQTTMWAINLSGAYAKFNHKNLADRNFPDEVINANVAGLYLRPISDRWSLLASAGVGLYADPDQLSADAILASGGAVFIYHWLENFDVGIGAGVSNAFGVPMVMPMVYLKWKKDGMYEISATMMNSVELAASVKFTDFLKLRLVAFEMDGITSVIKVDDTSMIFGSNSLRSFLSPEFNLGKKAIFHFGAGATWMRSAEVQERSLKTLFKSFSEDDKPNSYFQPSVLLNVGFKYNF